MQVRGDYGRKAIARLLNGLSSWSKCDLYSAVWMGTMLESLHEEDLEFEESQR